MLTTGVDRHTIVDVHKNEGNLPIYLGSFPNLGVPMVTRGKRFVEAGDSCNS